MTGASERPGGPRGSRLPSGRAARMRQPSRTQNGIHSPFNWKALNALGGPGFHLFLESFSCGAHSVSSKIGYSFSRKCVLQLTLRNVLDTKNPGVSSPPTSPKACGPQPEALASLLGPQGGPIPWATCRDSLHAGKSSHHGAGQHWWKQLHSTSTNQPPPNNRGPCQVTQPTCRQRWKETGSSLQASCGD